MGNHGLPECVGKGDWNEAEFVEYAADDGVKNSCSIPGFQSFLCKNKGSCKCRVLIKRFHLVSKRFMKFRSLFFMPSDMPWKITTDNLV